MKTRSKILITSFVLCAVVAIGATLAYFFDKTETKTNAFTMSDGIKIQLAEQKWDNKDYDGSLLSTPTDPLGETLSQNFVPGRVIPKNPSVKNVSGLEDVWIAVKLDYTVGTSQDNVPDNYAELANFADINWDAANWEANADNTIFYYKTKVSNNNVTSELFTTVTIKNYVPGAAYYPFDIKVTAYAVQAEGVDYNVAKTQLAGFINPAPQP